MLVEPGTASSTDDFDSEGTIAFVAIGDGLALDTEGSKIALTDRSGTALMKFSTNGAVRLIVKHQFVDIFSTG